MQKLIETANACDDTAALVLGDTRPNQPDQSEKVYRIQKPGRPRNPRSQSQSQKFQTQKSSKSTGGGGSLTDHRSVKCWKCGYNGHFAKDCSVAKDKECYRCGKVGHLAAACNTKFTKVPDRKQSDRSRTTNYRGQQKSEKTYTVSAENDCENEYVFSMNSLPSCRVYVANKPVDCLVDSGSSCNVININDAQKLNVKLKPCTKKLYPYGNEKTLNVVGSFETEIVYGDTSVYSNFVVVDHK